jgi:AcrR family transcriptional regulator
MQKLKDEVRNRIIEAAVNEFSRSGYEQAAMRDISKGAGISVSNTYNYYRNKEELFESIAKPVYETVKSIFRQSLVQSVQKLPSGGNTLAFIDDIAGKINQFDVRQRKILLILTEKSSGTRYEKSKGEMQALLRMHLEEAVRQPGGAVKEVANRGYILDIIAENFIDGLLKILTDYHDPAWTEANIKTLLAYHLNGIKALTG